MRNLTGALAQQKLTDAIIKAFPSGVEAEIIKAPQNDKIQEIRFQDRIFLFDKKSLLVETGIDVMLIDMREHDDWRQALNDAENYIACGELKGGIDPGGADEHWKTATAALERIREKLSPHCPKLFFVGAAIEQRMATEIFRDLENGRLQHAANLNYQNQLDDLVAWLAAL